MPCPSSSSHKQPPLLHSPHVAVATSPAPDIAWGAFCTGELFPQFPTGNRTHVRERGKTWHGSCSFSGKTIQKLLSCLDEARSGRQMGKGRACGFHNTSPVRHPHAAPATPAPEGRSGEGCYHFSRTCPHPLILVPANNPTAASLVLITLE